MENLITKMDQIIRRFDMIPPGAHVIVGLSGGADSVCLMEALYERKKNGRLSGTLEAVHVHHGLRATADRDEAYVRAFTEEREIPLRVVHVRAADYAAEQGLSTEEAGRILRQQAFAEAAARWADSACPVRIALAHHLEDSAETLLFHLCRGGRIAGFAGIRPVSGNVIHPLLTCSREEIEAFLRERRIPWCTDETNDCNDYTRNRIRHQVMPLLRSGVNAEADRHLAAAALEAAEAEAFLEAETEKARRRCLVMESIEGDGNAEAGGQKNGEAARPEADSKTGIIRHQGGEITRSKTDVHMDYVGATGGEVYAVSRLQALAPFMRRRVLYAALVRAAGRKKDISAEHVAALDRLLQTGGSAELTLPCGILARKQYDDLWFERRMTEQRELPEPGRSGERWRWNGVAVPTAADAYETRVFDRPDGAVIPPGLCTKWFDYDKITSTVDFRTRRPGDRLTLSEEGSSKTLGRCFIDGKMPAGLRGRVVLPMCGQEVLWIPGYRVSAAFLVSENTRRILEIRLDME